MFKFLDLENLRRLIICTFLRLVNIRMVEPNHHGSKPSSIGSIAASIELAGERRYYASVSLECVGQKRCPRDDVL